MPSNQIISHFTIFPSEVIKMALSYEEQDNSFIALNDYMLSNDGGNNGKRRVHIISTCTLLFI